MSKVIKNNTTANSLDLEQAQDLLVSYAAEERSSTLAEILEQLRDPIINALRNGVTRAEIGYILMRAGLKCSHSGFYSAFDRFLERAGESDLIAPEKPERKPASPAASPASRQPARKSAMSALGGRSLRELMGHDEV